jgi:hypothetical protein
MKLSRTPGRAMALAGLAACCCLLALFVSTASAIAPVTLEFREPEKGVTYAYIDQAPKTTFSKHGQPALISAGDEEAITIPVLEGGQKIGHLQATCTATKTSKDFVAASFQCFGTYVLRGGTLVATTTFSKGSTNEGAILGGTGTYANARGTFTTTEHKGFSTTVVTLAE